MFRLIAVVLIWLLSGIPALAADLFVRPNGGAYGAEDCSDWTNACDGFSDISWASVACGDTIWVAGGNYTQILAPDKDCSAGSTLAIRRARSDAAAATGAAGWAAEFDALVNHTNSININTSDSNILVSGLTVAAGAPCTRADNSGCGWKVDRSGTGTSGGHGINVLAASTGNTFEYLEFVGAGLVDHCDSGCDHRAIDLTPSGTASNFTFQRLYIHDWSEGVTAVSCSGPIFDHIDMSDIASLDTVNYHPNGIITWGCPNGIVRHSKFYKGPNGKGVGEGVFFEQSGGSTGWKIYGNLFYDLDSVGLKAIEISSDPGTILIYNNTFYNLIVNAIHFTDSAVCGASSETKNNLALNETIPTCGTNSNNLNTASDPFVNLASKDFHIISTTGAAYPRDAGVNLGAPYDTDLDGVTRGSDGTWDIGAFEFETEGGGGGGTDSAGVLWPWLAPVED